MSFMLSVTYVHYAQCRYAECHYAECRYAECRYAELRGASVEAKWSYTRLIIQRAQVRVLAPSLTPGWRKWREKL